MYNLNCSLLILTAALSWCSASQWVGTPLSSSFFFSGLSGSCPSMPIADLKVLVGAASLPPKMDPSLV